MRKIHVRNEMVPNDQYDRVNEAIIQVKTRITVVRIAAAKFESTPVTPIFARTAVAPAKMADSNDQTSQLFISAACLHFDACFFLERLVRIRVTIPARRYSALPRLPDAFDRDPLH